MLLEDLFWPRGLKGILSAALQREVEPVLEGLGFSPVTTPRKGSFRTKWLRDRESVIDAIDFQWDTPNRPKFAINFRDFSHPDDLEACRSHAGSIQPGDFGMRAYMGNSIFAWFKPSLPRALFDPERACERLVPAVVESIRDIDRALKGGAATTPMGDSPLWLDPRLPGHPPPWNEPGEGGPGSRYHLPEIRVGSGTRLATWKR